MKLEPQCCECGKPIDVDQEVGQEIQYVRRDGELKPIHEDCLYEGIESGGRGTSHGGCVTDPSS